MKTLAITAIGNTASFIFEGGKRFFHFEGDFDGNTFELQYSFGGTYWSVATSEIGEFTATESSGAWIDLPQCSMRAAVTGAGTPDVTLRIIDNSDKIRCT